MCVLYRVVGWTGWVKYGIRGEGETKGKEREGGREGIVLR